MTFDWSSMILKKEELTDAGKDHGVREKVELDVLVPDSLPKFIQMRKMVLILLRKMNNLRNNSQKIVSCKWVYKKKDGIPGIEDARYKARLIPKGFTQRKDIDYNEIFSPLVKCTSIRLLLAMVALYDLELEQLDVKTTFLHGELEELILMRQPEEFVNWDKDDHVCCLLVQEILVWIKAISKVVV
ncbi:hypothetical protein RJ639_001562 [Escallonia herrerae]|uniref:Reverse transcriptase Ty1/copia-type domain-containing protein n=1 Tax=Escallonia herrerae TaxID=1293975 RepID=A0AA89BIQ0_9ASTE|nr:hypothetical protein RJ639_001562 [Escallonia herrerae]